MKKILIISYYYAPENKIGALRPTKIGKYLSSKDVSVDVLTKFDESNLDSDVLYFKRDLDAINKIIKIKHSNIFYKIFKRKNNSLSIEVNSKIQKSRSSLLNKGKKLLVPRFLKILYRQMMDYYRSLDFYLQTKKYISNNTNEFAVYDSVFTTYGPITSLMCGNFIKSKFNIKWICDFRDPMTNESNSYFVNKLNTIMQLKYCNRADYITTVSKGYLDRICKGRFRHKSFVIPNGYDIDDKIPNGSSTNFSFVYVGALYEGKRKITPIFKALRSLIDEGTITKQDINFYYAGSESEVLINQSKLYDLQDVIINKGNLTRQKCLQLQATSRFLVLSTWNNQDEIGVFPGKFLEYMLFGKPIISLVDGNLKDSEVTRVMEDIELGVTYESLRSNYDYNKLKDYIMNDYIRFKEGLQPVFKPNNKLLDRYDYRNISEQIKELI